MREWLADILGAMGSGAIVAAVWLLAGGAWALIPAGVALIVAAVLVANGEVKGGGA
jgi:hypothetical protein